METVPVTGFAANFSPIPRIAPPPLGREIAGAEKDDRSDALLFSCFACGVELSRHLISLLQRYTGTMKQKDDRVQKLISQTIWSYCGLLYNSEKKSQHCELFC